MAKQRTDKQPARTAKPASAEGNAGWALGARVLASLAVAWHVFAVFISPFASFSNPPASPLVLNVASSTAVRAYAEPLYIAGGYQFFSPDPPRRARLITFSVTDDQGEEIAKGQFPNRADERYDRQWPRLWYHRHMMLADQMGDVPIVRNADGTVSPEANNRLWLRSYARHLLRKHGGAVATLEVTSHASLYSDDAWPPARIDPTRREEPPMEPTNPQLYQTVDTVREFASNLGQPLLAPRTEPEQEPEALPLGTPL